MITRTLILFLTVFSFCAVAQASPDFTERTPAYFVDRYGYSKSSKNVKVINAVHERLGNQKVKGQFSVREFRSGDLRVKATFALPSLKLVSVWLQLPRKWTDQQIEAALNAYGSDWTDRSKTSVVQVWTNTGSLKVINMLTFLEIQSPLIAQIISSELAKKEAKKKAVPKF